MKKFYLLVFLILMITACSFMALAATKNANFGISEAGTPAKQYFPGDIIHLVVQAPIDTDHLSALMPDNRTVKFSFEPATNLWHGYWEVPANFKKGSYNANLVAVDFDGNTFEGMTTAFFIGESAVQMANLSPTEEATLKEQQAKKLAAEALILAEESQEKLSQARALMPEKVAAETKPAPQAVVAAAPPAEKPIKTAAVKPTVKPRKKAVAAMTKEDLNITRLKLITKARAYMLDHNYEKAKEQLLVLLKLSPDDAKIKLMLDRVEAIIKSGQETP
jgi:hypothetical protein